MTNANRYYLIPFAENGNKAEITDLSVGGAVSYDTGYGPDYELAQGDPNRKRIERAFYNGALNSATKNIKQWQERVFPTWIEDKGDASPFAYSKNAIVDHNGVYYISLVASNVSAPASGNDWRVFNIAEISAYTEPLGNKNVYMRHTMVRSPDSAITFPPFVGTTGDYGPDEEIAWGLWSGSVGTQDVTITDGGGLSWGANDIELRYDMENSALFAQGDETVYIVDQSGSKYWLKVADTAALTSTLTVNALAVQVSRNIFADLGITSILQIGLQDVVGVFGEKKYEAVEREVRGGFILIENVNGSARIYADGFTRQTGVKVVGVSQAVTTITLPVPYAISHDYINATSDNLNGSLSSNVVSVGFSSRTLVDFRILKSGSSIGMAISWSSEGY